MYKSGLLAVK